MPQTQLIPHTRAWLSTPVQDNASSEQAVAAAQSEMVAIKEQLEAQTGALEGGWLAASCVACLPAMWVSCYLLYEDGIRVHAVPCFLLHVHASFSLTNVDSNL